MVSTSSTGRGKLQLDPVTVRKARSLARRAGKPIVGVLVDGGPLALTEATKLLAEGWPLITLAGSGRAAASSESSRMTYKVRSGDTLSEIAEKFDVSVREVMTWNKLRKSTSLRTGQRLVLYVDSNKLSGG